MIEDALPFTIDKTSLDEDGQLLLETRGLLQMKDMYVTGHFSLSGHSTIRRVDKLHIELMFVKLSNPEKAREYDWLGDDYSKIRIFFEDIQSIILKRGIFKSRFVFKFKPEKRYLLLNIDPINREMVLNISRRDADLAKQFESAIALKISETKFKKLLKDIEQPLD